MNDLYWAFGSKESLSKNISIVYFNGAQIDVCVNVHVHDPVHDRVRVIHAQSPMDILRPLRVLALRLKMLPARQIEYWRLHS